MKWLCESFRGADMVRHINIEADNSCEALELFAKWYPMDSDCVVTCEEGERMNILEYIDSLVDEGYSEEDAGRMADCLYNTDWDCADEAELTEDDGYDDYDFLEWMDAQEEL